MDQDEEQRYPDCGGSGRRVGDSPCEAGQEEEEREKVGERWIGAVVGLCRFYWVRLGQLGREIGVDGVDGRFCAIVSVLPTECACVMAYGTYMVVDVTEHFFGCDYEVCHFPYCLESGQHPDFAPQVCVPNTASKSMDVNLKSRRKKGGTRILRQRLDDMAKMRGVTARNNMSVAIVQYSRKDRIGLCESRHLLLLPDETSLLSRSSMDRILHKLLVQIMARCSNSKDWCLADGCAFFVPLTHSKAVTVCSALGMTLSAGGAERDRGSLSFDLRNGAQPSASPRRFSPIHSPFPSPHQPSSPSSPPAPLS